MHLRKGLLVMPLLLLVALVTMGASSPMNNTQYPQRGSGTGAGEASREIPEASYSQVIAWGDEGKIKKIELQDSYQGTVTLKEGRSATFSYIPGETAFVDQLARQGVEVRTDGYNDSGGGSFGSVMMWIILVALIVMMISMIMGRRARRRAEANEADGSGPESEDGEGNSVAGFSDVAGLQEAVEEVSEFSSYLKNPEPFQAVGARMPKGILLHGPPGTGKTLLAKALAAEAGVAFFAVSGTDFVEKYVGVGASRVRSLFKKARSCEDGAVVFIDEIDAVGRKRSDAGEGGNDEREGTLNEILVQIDGFNESSRVLVVGATNRLDVLDEALLRPGRLSRQIYISSPDEGARKEILALYATDKPLASGVSLGRLARITAGSSGADLEEMLNEAAIMAAREGRDQICESDIWEGHLRVLAGPERSSSPASQAEQKIVAYHEAGHVLVAELCPEHEKAERATIRPRAQAAGLAVYGQRDRAIHSESYFRQQLLCILGGRAAEQVAFGRVSSGAANDLQRASALARRAVEEWGLSEQIGQSANHGQRDSEERLGQIDNEVAGLVDGAYHEACRLLRENKRSLQSLAEKLLEVEDITRLEIEEAVGLTHAPRKKSQWPEIKTTSRSIPRGAKPEPKPWLEEERRGTKILRRALRSLRGGQQKGPSRKPGTSA